MLAITGVDHQPGWKGPAASDKSWRDRRHVVRQSRFRSLSGLLSRVRCWPNGDECDALGAAKSLAYSQAEQRCRRAVWPQPGGTGRFGGNSVVAGRWQWAGTAARPAPRTALQSASVAYATVSPTGSYTSRDRGASQTRQSLGHINH